MLHTCKSQYRYDITFFLFFNMFYCLSSDFSDLPDITGEYIVLSEVYSTGTFLTLCKPNCK